jgi:hypothetical protein
MSFYDSSSRPYPRTRPRPPADVPQATPSASRPLSGAPVLNYSSAASGFDFSGLSQSSSSSPFTLYKPYPVKEPSSSTRFSDLSRHNHSSLGTDPSSPSGKPYSSTGEPRKSTRFGDSSPTTGNRAESTSAFLDSAPPLYSFSGGHSIGTPPCPPTETAASTEVVLKEVLGKAKDQGSDSEEYASDGADNLSR